jgi:dTDP-4-dehydrorhamnose 3,5-epimerase
MRFTEARLPGAFMIDLEFIRDSRGFFSRAWCERELAQNGLETRVAQCNLSHSGHRGTLRGMHYQRPPFQEAKVIRCIRGSMYDVIVDLRPDSPCFRGWMGVELSASNRRSLYVPPGFAHGFQTLEDDTEAFYMTSEFFTPDAEGGVRWDDPVFGIRWPIDPPSVISDKDASWPDYPG